MLSLEIIKSMNQEAMQQALNEGKLPINVFVGDSEYIYDIDKVRNIPNIGDLRPEGYVLEKTYFVDSSGFGSEHEPALTFNQFLQVLRSDRYYAIIEAGQFQVYIGEFRRE